MGFGPREARGWRAVRAVQNRSRRALDLAQHEAHHLDHDDIGTERLLLGLLAPTRLRGMPGAGHQGWGRDQRIGGTTASIRLGPGVARDRASSAMSSSAVVARVADRPSPEAKAT